MTRDEAIAIVDQITFRVEQYRAVSWLGAQLLLGDAVHELANDPIRCKGPTVGTVYPWNVVDYIELDETKREKASAVKAAIAKATETGGRD